MFFKFWTIGENRRRWQEWYEEAYRNRNRRHHCSSGRQKSTVSIPRQQQGIDLRGLERTWRTLFARDKPFNPRDLDKPQSSG